MKKSAGKKNEPPFKSSIMGGNSQYLREKKRRENTLVKPTETMKTLAGKTVNVAKKSTASVKPPKATRSVEKYKGIYSRTVDGKDQMVKEKGKTVTKGGLTKKTVVKGKGMKGSVIGKYKEVKRFK